MVSWTGVLVSGSSPWRTVGRSFSRNGRLRHTPSKFLTGPRNSDWARTSLNLWSLLSTVGWNLTSYSYIFFSASTSSSLKTIIRDQLRREKRRDQLT